MSMEGLTDEQLLNVERKMNGLYSEILKKLDSSVIFTPLVEMCVTAFHETEWYKKAVNESDKTTKAEVDALSIQGKPFTMPVQSDGIALDTLNDTLYFHALSGYSLYAINTYDIEKSSNDVLAEKVRKVATTGAPDGMIFHQGNVYLADLEKQEVQYLTPSLDLRILVKGDVVNWADTFSIYNNALYYTNSKIQDAGSDVSDMTFEVYKTALPAR